MVKKVEPICYWFWKLVSYSTGRPYCSDKIDICNVNEAKDTSSCTWGACFTCWCIESRLEQPQKGSGEVAHVVISFTGAAHSSCKFHWSVGVSDTRTIISQSSSKWSAFLRLICIYKRAVSGTGKWWKFIESNAVAGCGIELHFSEGTQFVATYGITSLASICSGPHPFVDINLIHYSELLNSCVISNSFMYSHCKMRFLIVTIDFERQGSILAVVPNNNLCISARLESYNAGSFCSRIQGGVWIHIGNTIISNHFPSSWYFAVYHCEFPFEAKTVLRYGEFQLSRLHQ